MKFQMPTRENIPTGDDYDISWTYAGKTNPVTTAVFLRRLRKSLALAEERYETVLELGTGCGILLPTLSRNSRTVFALDIEDRFAGLRNLCSKEGLGNVNFMRGDITALPLNGKKFDLVIAVSILEHVHNLDKVFDSVKGVLSEGGEFLAGYPVEGFLTNMAFRLSGLKKLVDTAHVSDYRDIRQAIRKNFNVRKTVRMPRLLPDSFTLYEAAICSPKGASLP